MPKEPTGHPRLSNSAAVRSRPKRRTQTPLHRDEQCLLTLYRQEWTQILIANSENRYEFNSFITPKNPTYSFPHRFEHRVPVVLYEYYHRALRGRMESQEPNSGRALTYTNMISAIIEAELITSDMNVTGNFRGNSGGLSPSITREANT